MKTLARDGSDQEFEKFWQSAENEIIRIETLQDYSGEDNSASLSAWLAGDKDKSLRLLDQTAASEQKDWIEMCQDMAAKKVRLKRYHVVSVPYSDYLEWEIAHYQRINIPLCKEEVFLVDEAELRRTAKTKLSDIMLIDSRLAIENRYDKTGCLLDQTFYSENDNITDFLKLKAYCERLGQSLA